MGNGAAAKQKQAAVTNGRAPQGTYTPPMNDLRQLSSNNLLEIRGVKILAAARVDVSSARFRDRSSLPMDDDATKAAVDVSATAAPARLIM
mmetsp:Transcript_27745/g.46045  ORF Transcript_27745/g.46045 Transcript_27745/m.46045 type:complete len:91 (+) Transcript_27745:94-366(+)